MSQLGVFILWQSGEKYAQDIIDDLSKQFYFLNAKSLKWNYDDVCTNLNKLYPHRKFDYSSAKVKEIGADKSGVRLHILILKDINPSFENGINIKFKQLKEKYRKQYKTNFLHAADNEIEALDNIYQLLNQDYKNYKKKDNKFVIFDKFKNKFLESKIRDLNNIKEVLEVLNQNNVNYVILRNWEEFDGEILSEEHSDIDILTDDLYLVVSLLNAKILVYSTNRFKYGVKIGSQIIPLDLRRIDEKYYDRQWAKEILKTKTKFKYFNIPENENYYYSLLYHALIQKPFLISDYRNKLKSLKNDEISIKNLKEFMAAKNYKFVNPEDKTGFYRYNIQGYIFMLKYFLKKIGFVKELVKWIKK